MIVPATELANYVVAHSEFSTPVNRPNLLSALMANEAAVNGVPEQPQPRTLRSRSQARMPSQRARGRFAWIAFALAAAAAAVAQEPREWLERMNQALTARNYDGVFAHWQDGRVEMLRIIHRNLNGAGDRASGLARWFGSRVHPQRQ